VWWRRYAAGKFHRGDLASRHNVFVFKAATRGVPNFHHFDPKFEAAIFFYIKHIRIDRLLV
jgi:hypothetical protein